jgi:hypothetical protein
MSSCVSPSYRIFSGLASAASLPTFNARELPRFAENHIGTTLELKRVPIMREVYLLVALILLVAAGTVLGIMFR